MSNKILIDSGSDLNESEAKNLGLNFIPMQIQFGDREYLDGIDLFGNKFFELLEKSNDLPKTSLINYYRWNETFEELTKDGSEVMAITLSSKLSGTYNAALDASKNFNGVRVVDSLNATYGEAILGIYALELVKKGLSLNAIIEELEEKKKDICVYAVIDTLKYLKKGGRISATAAIAGTLLSVKVVIGVINGEVQLINKVIGRKKGNSFIRSLVDSTNGIDYAMPYGLIYSGTDTTNLDNFKTDIKDITLNNHFPEHSLGCTIGTHIGPGAVGIVYFKKV